MPELPEVETVRRDLNKVLSGLKIKSISVLAPKMVSPGAATFKKRLQGLKITRLDRRGKLLIVVLDTPDLFLLLHLKMTGQLIYVSPKTIVAGGHSDQPTIVHAPVLGPLPNKHTRVIFTFNDGSHLFFNDLRKFGYLKLASTKELDQIIAKNYGPEPLDKNFKVDDFSEKLKKSQRSIKAVLLDQKVVAGLGNIYVDEALFRSGILPHRPASSLKPAESQRLYEAIPPLLRESIEQRGTTFRNYVDSRGQRGNFSSWLEVYGRGGEKCVKCRHILVKDKVAGRGTVYCPKCQK